MLPSVPAFPRYSLISQRFGGLIRAFLLKVTPGIRPLAPSSTARAFALSLSLSLQASLRLFYNLLCILLFMFAFFIFRSIT